LGCSDETACTPRSNLEKHNDGFFSKVHLSTKITGQSSEAIISITLKGALVTVCLTQSHMRPRQTK